MEAKGTDGGNIKSPAPAATSTILQKGSAVKDALKSASTWKLWFKKKKKKKVNKMQANNDN